MCYFTHITRKWVFIVGLDRLLLLYLFYFIKDFMKLCIRHFDLMPFAIFLPRDWFHAHTIFDPFWQKTGSSGFWRPDLAGTCTSPKVPSLEHMMGVVVHPIQAAIAFGELSNLYGASHKPEADRTNIAEVTYEWSFCRSCILRN